MTKQELNRDIKKMYKSYAKAKDKLINDSYYKYIEEILKPEFIRLYRADDDAKYINIENLKRMMRLNQRHNFIPHHVFYIKIDY